MLKGLVAALCVALAPAIAAGQDAFFDSQGVRIHYVEQGAGDPIVLVHGQGGSVQTWISSGVLENLSRDHRVIALDCRGHGSSGKPHDPRLYGREMALDVVRLLDHLGIRQAHVVGYSLGAQLTSLLLTLQPNRFLTATLAGATGRFPWTAKDDQLAQQEAAEFERLGISPTLQRQLAPPNAPPLSDEQIKQRSEAVLADPSQDRFAIAALTRSRGDQAITREQVAAVKVPTLGIVGELDPALPQFRELNQLRPGMKLVIIAGATHGGERGIVARPELVAAIRDFIASHPSRRVQ